MNISQSNHRGWTDAFTLIELLVVIAIIAMMAAMLFPAVSRSMERGRSASCMSNVRSIGQATIAYVTDNRSRLPTQFENQANPYTAQLQSYLPDPGAWLCPSITRWKCPNDKWKQGRKRYLPYGDGWGDGWPSYGPNDKHTVKQWYSGDSYLDIEAIPQPASVYGFGEMTGGFGNYPSYWIACPMEYNADAYSYDIHLGGNNVAFLDGHVASVAQERMKEKPTRDNDPWFHFEGR